MPEPSRRRRSDRRATSDSSRQGGEGRRDEIRRLEDEIERLRRENESDRAFMLRLSNALEVAERPDRVARTAIRRVGEWLRADRCHWVAVDPDRDAVTVIDARAGASPGAADRSPDARDRSTDAPWIRLLREHAHGRTIIVSDTAVDPRTRDDYAARYRPARCRAVLAVPIARANGWVGSLVAIDAVPRTWDQRAITLARVAAEYIWFAYRAASAIAAERSVRVEAEAAREDAERASSEAVTARREAERHTREETALREAIASVTVAMTVQDATQRIATGAVAATRADGAIVERIDAERGEVEIVATAGERVPSTGERSRFLGSFTQRVIERGEPELIPEIGRVEGLLPDHIKRVCADCPGAVIPLLDAGEPVGALFLVREPGHGAFRRDEIERAFTFGDLASLAFRKIHMLEESERRRTELQRITESRARLIRGFSHDVKNPLGAADGNLQLLEEGVVAGLSAEQRERVSRARRSVRSALRLIEDLTEHARAEAGEVEVDIEPMDAREASRETADEFRAQADAREIELVTDVPDEFPVVESDADRVRQILSNLLSNAVKFTPAGGRVTVRTRVRDDGDAPAPGRWVTISVEDTGPGIPESEVPRLFREFTRLEATRGERGSGIGLAISYRIAQALGGTITVRSEVGRGSIFTLWLPLERVGAERQEGTDGGGPERRRGRARDDETAGDPPAGDRPSGHDGARGGDDARDRDGRRRSPTRTEREMRGTEVRIRRIAENIREVLWMSTADGRELLYVSPAVERVWGRPVREFYDDPGLFLHTIHPEDRAEIETRTNRARVTGEFEAEYRIVRPDGGVRWIWSRSVPIPDESGGASRIVGIAEDITERRGREESQRFLVEASQVLASSLDYAETLRHVARLAVPQIADWCAVNVLDAGRIRLLAVAHTDPDREALARDVARRWPSDPDAETGVARVLRTGEAELLPEIPREVLAGMSREPEHLAVLESLGLRSAMIVPMSARGHILGALTFIAAESGRRYGRNDLALAESLAARAAIAVDNARLYEEAERASRAKTEFLAVMSHELRTPLTAVIGYADILRSGIDGPVNSAQRQRLDRIEASARHLVELIEEILAFSRMESGRESVRIETVDLAAVAREVAARVRPSAVEEGLEFRLDIPEEPVEAETDAAKVRRILLNLLTNAVRFTPEGEVVITLEATDRTATFDIRDTGLGMAPEQIEHIFEPFWQAAGALTRETGGTGLGLTVARRLARMLGGDIQVESEVGVGSTFSVRLPRHASAPA
ncbi:MAG: ATP-binding protein [Gemmatimonadota bacterium]